MHNVIHLSIGHVLGMNADSVGMEALKSEVKDEPNDNEGNILHTTLVNHFHISGSVVYV